MFPERFSNLPAYAFPRLRSLLDVHTPGGDVVHMTIGEPKHAFPPWIIDVIAEHSQGFNNYPNNDGIPELISAITGWLDRRFGINVGIDQVMALNGTREGLYNAAMALLPSLPTRMVAAMRATMASSTSRSSRGGDGSGRWRSSEEVFALAWQVREPM